MRANYKASAVTCSRKAEAISDPERRTQDARAGEELLAESAGQAGRDARPPVATEAAGCVCVAYTREILASYMRDILGVD